MTSNANSKSPHKDTIRRMLFEEGLHKSEVIRRLEVRVSRGWAQTLVSQVIREASREDMAKLSKPTRGGGFEKIATRKPLSQIHLTIGVKLSNYRNHTEGLQHAAFTEKYGLSNQSRLSEMEAGQYDFKLSELMRLAEIIGQPLEEVVKTFSDNIYKNTAA